jgi:two-component system nitrogen regulation sensor histidine kinase NtrY
VPTPGTGDELDVLSRAFNRMTGQLEAQRDELIEANRQLDERRRFTEAVLAGVASGVIGLDAEGCLNLPNRTGSELLGIDLDAFVGQPLREIVPQMADALDESRRRPARLVESQVTITVQGRARTLLVRVTAEVAGGDLGGFVVTFTDITALLAAQRKAAWADIARRIAHEIKNPLTPIQLAAERLRRRYLPQITNDPETFQQCTDTIVRQVDDLRQMVDEFSSFARLPTPVMAPEDLADICRKAVFLQRQAHSDIDFGVVLPEHGVLASCDRRQINQVLTNLLQNAADAIEAARAAGSIEGRGWIGLRMQEEDGRAMILVEDNGVGLPTALKDRLTEPYVTTRSKGTGLGLAIAKKIMEEHGGELVLEDREERGARAVIALPLLEEIAVGAPSASDGEPPTEGRQSGKKAYGA